MKLLAPAAERVANDDNDHNRLIVTPTHAPLAVLCLSYINEGPSDSTHESVRSPYGSVYKPKRCSAERRCRLPAGEPHGSRGSNSEAGHGLFKNQHRGRRGQKWWSTSRPAAHGTHSDEAAYDEGAGESRKALHRVRERVGLVPKDTAAGYGKSPGGAHPAPDAAVDCPCEGAGQMGRA